MKIWFISDTHTAHEELRIPANLDMVVHCGDESNQRKTRFNEPEARRFFEWYAALEIPSKLFVPGNHSTAVEHGLIQPQEFPGIKFLVHEAAECDGLKFFGSPYTPWFFAWAYNVARPDLEPLWAEIPKDIDILITHGPPKGILDVTRDYRSKQPIHIGSLSLTKHVAERIKPRIHAFGHLHDEEGIRNFGSSKIGTTEYLNCACCDLGGRLVNHGHVIELEPRTEVES